MYMLSNFNGNMITGFGMRREASPPTTELLTVCHNNSIINLSVCCACGRSGKDFSVVSDPRYQNG